MFQHIVVPLDGSVQAEQAVPVAAHLARVGNGSLLLLQIVTTPIDDHQYHPTALLQGVIQQSPPERTRYERQEIRYFVLRDLLFAHRDLKQME